MTQQPEELEEISQPRGLVEAWFEAYNRVDSEGIRKLCHYPLVSFGGAIVGRENLNVSIHEQPTEFAGGARRDEGWDHSLIDRFDIRQHSPSKSHVLVDFRRCKADGSPYGIGLSRLSICTKLEGKWGIQMVSSCGLRDPDHVEESTDAEVVAEATEIVMSLIDAYSNFDDMVVKDYCNYPFISFSGPRLSIARGPDELSLDIDRVAEETGWQRSEIETLEVLPPQAGDKVVVDVTVRRFASRGGELPPESAIYVVTKQNGRWGLQCSSTKSGVGGLP